MYYLVKRNVILVLYADRGSFITPPYLDVHGEAQSNDRSVRSQGISISSAQPADHRPSARAPQTWPVAVPAVPAPTALRRAAQDLALAGDPDVHRSQARVDHGPRRVGHVLRACGSTGVLTSCSIRNKQVVRISNETGMGVPEEVKNDGGRGDGASTNDNKR